MIKSTIQKTAISISAAIFLTACGGSSDSTPTTSVDKIAPVIKLKGTTAPISIGGTYTELGATVTDNVDKGLTAKITGSVDTSKAGTYTITYTATDKAGNKSSKTRVVKVVEAGADTTAPVITLTGTTAPITVGGTYTELGATAIDDVDGSVAPVITGDTVDTSTAGTYTITYTATDVAGNSAVKTRAVKVVAAEVAVISPLATGQTVSYNAAGAVVTDIEDDGKLKKGVDSEFTRDDNTNIVTDNLTGLKWADDAAVYTFKSPDLQTYCSTTYGAGWRSPTLSELKGLVNYAAFPFLYSEFNPDNRSVEGAAFLAIGGRITFKRNAKPIVGEEGTSGYLRCVSGTTSFVADIDTTVADQVTDKPRKLVWKDDATVIGLHTWTEALTYCTGLDGDWRVPNMNELESITDRTQVNSLVAGFTQLGSGDGVNHKAYWSSTTVQADDERQAAWTVNYENNYNMLRAKSEEHYVRCVSDLTN